VQAATDLASANWINAGAAIRATHSTLTASWSLGAASQQFYRIIMLP
jgi:hypothetical protein